MIINFFIFENGNFFYDFFVLMFNYRNIEILIRVGWLKYLVSDDIGV